MIRHIGWSLIAWASVATVVVGCGGDGENTGRACEVVEDCFSAVDHEELSGPVECLTRVPDGYCTHQCETDDDCCAVEGECRTDLRQVCAPFESTGLRLCFLSCEPADREDYPEGEFCQEFAHPAFNCRSTGGGSMNRKVCVP